MGIISLNEKRTSALPKNTTGKEKSFFTGDRFSEIVVPAKITGKVFSWGASSSSAYGGFGAFWENTDGTLVSLEMEIGSNSPVNEQGSRLNTAADESWLDLEISLESVSDGRLIFYGRKTSITDHYKSDVDLDDIKFISTSGVEVDFDPSLTSVRTGNKWQRSDMHTFTNYSGAKSNYSSASFTDMGNTITDDNNSWNYTDEHGGGSSGTGSDNAADNNDETKYLYYEASSFADNQGKGTYVRWKNNYSLSTGEEL